MNLAQLTTDFPLKVIVTLANVIILFLLRKKLHPKFEIDFHQLLQ